MALSILTALCLIYAASVVALPGAGGSARNDSIVAVHSFYGAINAALRLGDATALAEVAPAELIVHGTISDSIIHRDELAARIMALRAAFPRMQITVADMVAEHERVLARIDLTGADRQGLLGVSAPSAYPETMMENFRVRDGMIVEYHGILADLVPPVQVLQESIGLVGTSQLIEIARLTIAPEARLDGQITSGPTIIAVQAGTVEVTITGEGEIRRAATSSTPSEHESTIAGGVSHMGNGDQIAMSALTGYALRSIASTPAVLIVATVMRANPRPGTSSDTDQPPPASPVPSGMPVTPDPRSALGRTVSQPGVEHQMLLPLLPLELPTSPASIAIWQITLAPGMAISGLPPAGAAFAIVASGRAVIERSTAPAQGEMVVASVGARAPLDPYMPTKIQNIGDASAVLLILTARPSTELATIAGRDPQADIPFAYCLRNEQGCRGH
jgi:hypothetical protein